MKEGRELTLSGGNFFLFGHTAAVPFSAFPTTTLNSSADTSEVAARRIAAIENFMVEIYPWEWYRGAIKVPAAIRDKRVKGTKECN